MNTKRTSLQLKLRYWFTYMAVGAGMPFITLYYKSVLSTPDGLPALGIIGTLLLIQPLLSIFSNPVAGVLADKFKIKDKILFFCAVFSGLGILFICVTGLPFFSGFTLLQKAALMGIGIIFLGFFLSPIVPLINAETLDHLHNSGADPGEYGTFRVFGSLSWILITSVTGLLLFLSNRLIVSPVLYATGFLLLAAITFSGTKSKIRAVKIPWQKLTGDRLFLKFLIFVFLQGFGLQSAYNFTSYFMDDLNLNYFAIGIAFAISAIPELPVMFKARDILKKIGGRQMIITGTGLLILKTLLLALFSTFHMGYLVILPMLIHGVGYSLQINGLISFINKRAHKDLRAIYMNLFGIFGMSLATAFGSFFNALVIKATDSTRMMMLDTGIAIVAILFFLIFVREKTACTVGHTGDTEKVRH